MPPVGKQAARTFADAMQATKLPPLAGRCGSNLRSTVPSLVMRKTNGDLLHTRKQSLRFGMAMQCSTGTSTPGSSWGNRNERKQSVDLTSHNCMRRGYR